MRQISVKPAAFGDRLPAKADGLPHLLVNKLVLPERRENMGF
jgi:hypothetical protein